MLGYLQNISENISPSAVSGIKLDAQPLTIATAAILYHRFFKETDSAGYDSYVSCQFFIL
jgi:hypothetical protein